MWNLPAPPGFQGLHPDKPLFIYQRHLPHWRQEGATYFVTFRQSDSLPQDKLRQLELMHQEWEHRHPPPRTEEQLTQLTREVTSRIELWLDQGMGSCRLKGEAANIVVAALHYFDGERYELDSYVVMPNHVHLVVRPFSDETDSLERILQSWKRYTSREINRLFCLTGTFWQDESFDRIIRDEEHLYRVIQYIGRNPGAARLDRQQCPLWIRPDWGRLGWKFEAERKRDAE